MHVLRTLGLKNCSCPCACFVHFEVQNVHFVSLCRFGAVLFWYCDAFSILFRYYWLEKCCFFFVLLLYLLQGSHAFFVPRVRDFDHRVDAFQNQILVSEYAKFRLAHILAVILTSLCDKPRPGA